MVLNDATSFEAGQVIVHAPAEPLSCRFCGKDYFSRGKHDPGYCRNCEQKMIEGSAIFIGGPLNGKPASEVIVDDSV